MSYSLTSLGTNERGYYRHPTGDCIGGCHILTMVDAPAVDTDLPVYAKGFLLKSVGGTPGNLVIVTPGGETVTVDMTLITPGNLVMTNFAPFPCKTVKSVGNGSTFSGTLYWII